MNNIAKIAAVLTFAVAGATPSFAQTAQGFPFLSDGTTSLGLNINGQGVHEVNACGRSYQIPNDHGLQIFKSMRSNLQGSGYIWYHTDAQYKKWYACGWGKFSHLNGVLQ